MLLSTHALARQRQGIEVNASLPRGSSFSCSHRLRAGESNTAPLLNFTGMACCWTPGDQNVLASKLGQIKRAISVGGRSQISLMRDTCTTTSSAITFRKDPVCANRRFEEPQTVCSSVTAPVFQWEVSDTFRAFARSWLHLQRSLSPLAEPRPLLSVSFTGRHVSRRHMPRGGKAVRADREHASRANHQ
jgi:hypothetical protein